MLEKLIKFNVISLLKILNMKTLSFIQVVLIVTNSFCQPLTPLIQNSEITFEQLNSIQQARFNKLNSQGGYIFKRFVTVNNLANVQDSGRIAVDLGMFEMSVDLVYIKPME